MQIFVQDTKKFKSYIKQLSTQGNKGSKINEYLLITAKENKLIIEAVEDEVSFSSYVMEADIIVEGQMLVPGSSLNFELSTLPAKAGLNISVIDSFAYLKPDSIDGNKRLSLYPGEISDFIPIAPGNLKIGEISAKSLNNVIKLLRIHMGKTSNKDINLLIKNDRLYFYGTNSADNSFSKFFIDIGAAYNDLSISICSKNIIGDVMPNFELEENNSLAEIYYTSPHTNNDGNTVEGILTFVNEQYSVSFICSPSIDFDEIPYNYLNEFNLAASRVISFEEINAQAEWLKPATAIALASGFKLSAFDTYVKINPVAETSDTVRGLVSVTREDDLSISFPEAVVSCVDFAQAIKSLGSPIDTEFLTNNIMLSQKNLDDTWILELSSADQDENNAIIRLFNKPQQ
jgi:hypothetical protein